MELWRNVLEKAKPYNGTDSKNFQDAKFVLFLGKADKFLYTLLTFLLFGQSRSKFNSRRCKAHR